MANPISLIVVARDHAEDLARLLRETRPVVDEILVMVQPSEDNTLQVAQELADKVFETPEKHYIETHFEFLGRQARNAVVLNLDCDERLVHGERLEEHARSLEYDIWVLNRIDYLDGKRAPVFPVDPHPRMWRQGAMRWMRRLHCPPQFLSNRTCAVTEAWIEHRRTFDRIESLRPMYERLAQEEGNEQVAKGQTAFWENIAKLKPRVQRPDFPRSVLLSYNGVVGIGDTLMTTPAIRAVRKQWPNATITYLTQQGAVLQGNPYIDYIDGTAPDKWIPEMEEAYDLRFHWETSLTGQPGHRLNGYELEAQWIQVDPDDWHPDWFISPLEQAGADKFLSENVKTPRVVGFSLSSSCLHRTWQHSNDLAMNLLKEYDDITIIFFGDWRCQVLELVHDPQMKPVQVGGVAVPPHMEMRPAPYSGPGHDRIVRTSGKMDIRIVAGILNRCDLIIAPDSGLMHMAAALDKPCVAYFNLVPPELRIKHLPTVIPVPAEYPCSPCFIHGRIDCDKTTKEDGAPCLHTVTVERMMAAIEPLLP